jgi:hypothetical protein
MKRVYAAIFAALGWFAVIGQYFNAYFDVPGGIFNYVSFFTILSNILVATTLTSVALAPDSAFGRFLARPAVASTTALYITVTGLVYYFLLAALYDLEGWTKHFDHILHYVVPPAYVLFWAIWIPKGTLSLRNVPAMLLPPLLYGVYTLLRGPLADWYPYPFIDAATLGYPHTFRNIAEFIVFFALMGSVYVLADHLIARIKRAV